MTRKTVKLFRLGVFYKAEDERRQVDSLPARLPITVMFNPRYPIVGMATNLRIEDGWCLADVDCEREDLFAEGTDYAIHFVRTLDGITLLSVGQVPKGRAIQ